MIEWLGPILGSIVAGIVGMVISGLIWKGKMEEAHRQFRADYDAHIREADEKIRDFQMVRENQAVMRQEIVNMSARLIAGDKRLEELSRLSTNFAVMEKQLEGIHTELIEIKKELKTR